MSGIGATLSDADCRGNSLNNEFADVSGDFESLILFGDFKRYTVRDVMGMTLFLLFPFSRLVHVWSGFGTLAYVVRPYQVVRSRRLGLTNRGR